MSGTKTSWLDEGSNNPLIDEKARNLDSFTQALADGRVDMNELQEQEDRVVRLMKEIEPQLDDAMHEKITALLCEMSAYTMMQALYAMQTAAQSKTFHG